MEEKAKKDYLSSFVFPTQISGLLMASLHALSTSSFSKSSSMCGSSISWTLFVTPLQTYEVTFPLWKLMCVHSPFPLFPISRSFWIVPLKKANISIYSKLSISLLGYLLGTKLNLNRQQQRHTHATNILDILLQD